MNTDAWRGRVARR